MLFSGVALFASRSARVTVLMLVCLAGIPLVVLGLFGHLSIAVDIITSPAANLALAMGVDSMIHLVVRWRRLSHMSTPVGEGVDAWWRAREELLRPVIAVSAMICLGFGIFTFSAFPPTRRFGFAVILGTATAAFMALVVLPLAASRARSPKAHAVSPPVAPADYTT